MAQSPYSSDITPSTFDPFDPMKKQRYTCQSGSSEELQTNVHEILMSTGPSEITATMRVWMARLQKAIDTNGEYV
jgi:hypothetical protein